MLRCEFIGDCNRKRIAEAEIEERKSKTAFWIFLVKGFVVKIVLISDLQQLSFFRRTTFVQDDLYCFIVKNP